MNKIMTKTICVIVASLFLFNSVAYGLSPAPGSTQDAVKNESIQVFHQMLYDLRGPSVLAGAFSEEITPKGFTPAEEPLAEGISILKEVPSAMRDSQLFQKRDLIEALEYSYPGIEIVAENFQVKEGHFPIAKTEYGVKANLRQNIKITVHKDMVSTWNRIKSKDVIFKYTYSDGTDETFSLAQLMFDEIVSMGNKRREVRSRGVGIVRDAVRAWFIGAYLFANATRYDNDALETRVRWFCNSKEAREIGLADELPYISADEDALDRAIQLVRFINYHFYAPKTDVAGFTGDKNAYAGGMSPRDLKRLVQRLNIEKLVTPGLWRQQDAIEEIIKSEKPRILSAYKSALALEKLKVKVAKILHKDPKRVILHLEPTSTGPNIFQVIVGGDTWYVKVDPKTGGIIGEPQKVTVTAEQLNIGPMNEPAQPARPAAGDLPTAGVWGSLSSLAPHDVLNALLSSFIVRAKKLTREDRKLVEHNWYGDVHIFWLEGRNFRSVIDYLVRFKRMEMGTDKSLAVDDEANELNAFAEIMNDILKRPYISDDIRKMYDLSSPEAVRISLELLKKQLESQFEHLGVETGTIFISSEMKEHTEIIVAHARAERAFHWAVIKKYFDGDIDKYRKWRSAKSDHLNIDIEIRAARFGAQKNRAWRFIENNESYNGFAEGAHLIANDIAPVWTLTREHAQNDVSLGNIEVPTAGAADARREAAEKTGQAQAKVREERAKAAAAERLAKAAANNSSKNKQTTPHAVAQPAVAVKPDTSVKPNSHTAATVDASLMDVPSLDPINDLPIVDTPVTDVSVDVFTDASEVVAASRPASPVAAKVEAPLTTPRQTAVRFTNESQGFLQKLIIAERSLAEQRDKVNEILKQGRAVGTDEKVAFEKVMRASSVQWDPSDPKGAIDRALGKIDKTINGIFQAAGLPSAPNALSRPKIGAEIAQSTAEYKLKYSPDVGLFIGAAVASMNRMPEKTVEWAMGLLTHRFQKFDAGLTEDAAAQRAEELMARIDTPAYGFVRHGGDVVAELRSAIKGLEERLLLTPVGSPRANDIILCIVLCNQTLAEIEKYYKTDTRAHEVIAAPAMIAAGAMLKDPAYSQLLTEKMQLVSLIQRCAYARNGLTEGIPLIGRVPYAHLPSAEAKLKEYLASATDSDYVVLKSVVAGLLQSPDAALHETEIQLIEARIDELRQSSVDKLMDVLLQEDLDLFVVALTPAPAEPAAVEPTAKAAERIDFPQDSEFKPYDPSSKLLKPGEFLRAPGDDHIWLILHTESDSIKYIRINKEGGIETRVHTAPLTDLQDGSFHAPRLAKDDRFSMLFFGGLKYAEERLSPLKQIGIKYIYNLPAENKYPGKHTLEMLESFEMMGVGKRFIEFIRKHMKNDTEALYIAPEFKKNLVMRRFDRLEEEIGVGFNGSTMDLSWKNPYASPFAFSADCEIDIDQKIMDIRKIGDAGDIDGAEQLIKTFRYLIANQSADGEKLKRYIAEALGNLRSNASVDLLIEALVDKDADLRIRAAEALGKIRAKRAVPSLIRDLLTDDYPWPNRAVAAWALGEIGDNQALDPLITAMHDAKYWFVKLDIIQAIAKLGNPGALPALNKESARMQKEPYGHKDIDVVMEDEIKRVISALEDGSTQAPAVPADAQAVPADAQTTESAEAVMVYLRMMEQANPALLYDLTMAVRSHDSATMLAQSEALLVRMGLRRDGKITDIVRDIVASAVVGEGMNMKIISPAAPVPAQSQHIFTMTAATLKRIARDFRADLAARGTSGSSLSNIVTEIGIPTGMEKGTYYYIDLGGTNLRVGLAEFKGNHTIRKKEKEDELAVTVPKEIVTGGGRPLFDFIARTIKDFAGKRGVSGTLNTGFTFSFAMKKEGVNKGIITPECNVKGYIFNGVFGQEVVELLKEALPNVHLTNVSVEVPALPNDTEAVRDTGAYMNGKTIAGGVFGTGHNTAIRDRDGKSVNLESGAFDKLATNEASQDARMLDDEIDRRSSNPGVHPLEKRLSGKYVGPLFGLIIEREINEGRLFAGRLEAVASPIFTDHDYEKEGYAGFTGKHISEIEKHWQSGGVNALKEYFEALGVSDPSDEDVVKARDMARDIMTRSAQLGAATFAGIVMEREGTETPSGEYAYAIDGALLNYPGYIDMMKDALSAIFGAEYARKLEVFEAKDGAGIGAALTAMIVSTQAAPAVPVQPAVEAAVQGSARDTIVGWGKALLMLSGAKTEDLQTPPGFSADEWIGLTDERRDIISNALGAILDTTENANRTSLLPESVKPGDIFIEPAGAEPAIGYICLAINRQTGIVDAAKISTYEGSMEFGVSREEIGLAELVKHTAAKNITDYFSAICGATTAHINLVADKWQSASAQAATVVAQPAADTFVATRPDYEIPIDYYRQLRPEERRLIDSFRTEFAADSNVVANILAAARMGKITSGRLATALGISVGLANVVINQVSVPIFEMNEGVSLQSAVEALNAEDKPIITDIVTFTIPVGWNVGPGSVQPLGRDEVLNIWQAINLLNDSKVEIFLPVQMTENIQKALRDIRDRHGNDSINVRTFAHVGHLKSLLRTPPVKGVKRIVLSNKHDSIEIEYIASRNPDIFRATRLWNVAFPGNYENLTPSQKTFYQAQMIMEAMLARLYEKNNAPMVRMLLVSTLKGRVEGDVGEFIDRMAETDEEALDSEHITDRIIYCLGKTVSLIAKLGEEIEHIKLIMKEFWTAA